MPPSGIHAPQSTMLTLGTDFGHASKLPTIATRLWLSSLDPHFATLPSMTSGCYR